PAGQGLRDGRVSAAGELDNRGEIIVKLGMVRPMPVSRGVNRYRLSRLLKIPAGEVEEVNRLFEDPISHAGDVISPATRAEPIRFAPQFDERVKRFADRAIVDEMLHLPPQ